MTARIVAAIRNPYVNILAHPTTRKIGQRDPIQVDLDDLYAACASTGTAIEIDAYPDRMDLTGTQARAGHNAGCVIAADAGGPAERQLTWRRCCAGRARRPAGIGETGAGADEPVEGVGSEGDEEFRLNRTEFGK